jgi:hypothetical protein
MRRVLAAVLVAVLLLVSSVPAAQAGSSTDIALGLASFAVFNQLVGGFARPRHVETVVVHRPAVVYSAPPVVYGPPVVYSRPMVYAPPVAYSPAVPTPTVVQYPHGRYELQLRGQQYVWVWFPAVAPPPPPPTP